ncbi:MAG: hypothetical protein HYZ54_02320 [Ignavibacteriae bacterium]|nr:hypothetical protein [Ignavibacteriota bacterium]
MRTISHIILGILIFCTTEFYSVQSAIAQDRIYLIGATGIPELLSLGMRYQTGVAQVGFSIGSLPLGDETIVSLMVDGFYHFGFVSDRSSQGIWYVRVGADYLREETDFVRDNYIYSNFRIGRDFNLSDEITLSVDAGLLIQLYNNRLEKKSNPGIIDFNFKFPVFPSIGTTIVYRI